VRLSHSLEDDSISTNKANGVPRRKTLVFTSDPATISHAAMKIVAFCCIGLIDS
jgi:hypothetical protein